MGIALHQEKASHDANQRTSKTNSQEQTSPFSSNSTLWVSSGIENSERFTLSELKACSLLGRRPSHGHSRRRIASHRPGCGPRCCQVAEAAQPFFQSQVWRGSAALLERPILGLVDIKHCMHKGSLIPMTLPTWVPLFASFCCCAFVWPVSASFSLSITCSTSTAFAILELS